MLLSIWLIGLQCAEDAQGEAILEGEFNSMCELYKIAPQFVARPYTWVKLCNPDTYYFLSDFIEMTNDAPGPVQLSTKLIQMQQASESPIKKFGFHISTSQGNFPQQTARNKS